MPDTIDCTDPEGCEPGPETPYPTDDGDCVLLYEDCDYQGMNTRICKDTPFTDIDYEVKSVKVPEGKTIYLYNLPCFNG